jgi:hypothetical protein
MFARRAAGRTAPDALRLFAVGVGAITAGAILGGAVNLAPGIGPKTGVILRPPDRRHPPAPGPASSSALFAAAGLAVLGHSLHVDRGRSGPPDAV